MQDALRPVRGELEDRSGPARAALARRPIEIALIVERQWAERSGAITEIGAEGIEHGIGTVRRKFVDDTFSMGATVSRAVKIALRVGRSGRSSALRPGRIR